MAACFPSLRLGFDWASTGAGLMDNGLFWDVSEFRESVGLPGMSESNLSGCILLWSYGSLLDSYPSLNYTKSSPNPNRVRSYPILNFILTRNHLKTCT